MSAVFPVFCLADLARSGRDVALPVEIALASAGVLRLEAWLRVLPGRRYVGQGIWQDAAGGQRQVLAKLLVGKKAARQFAQEQEGARLLASQGLPTPALLAAEYVADSGGWLLFEFLENARAPDAKAIDKAVSAIARLHGRGLWQKDLHPDNLLLQNGQLYFVDGGGIGAETPGQALSQKRALENLGMFYAQWPIGMEAGLSGALALYRAQNPVSGAKMRLPALQQAVDRQRRRRLRNWLKKITRECSDFCLREKGAFGFCIARRDSEKILAPLLENPDAFIAGGTLYKDGGTATVARVEVAGQLFVIKRYNIKHFRHRLSRCWRRSRAWRAWREGNRLMALGIPTARPLALIERRCCGFSGVAYLVTEYLPGEDILQRLRAEKAAADAPEIAAIGALFAELSRARLSHGDLKGHNLIWREKEARWALVDLDAMRAHRHALPFEHAHRRDCRRFLLNWSQDASLLRLFSEQIK
jgi:tRNA A-37 threonylcarbamoyl transferase component Bud32